MLTPQEIAKLKETGLGVKPGIERKSLAQRTDVQIPTEEAKTSPGFFERQKEILTGSERTERVKGIVDPYMQGKQSLTSTGFQLGGEAIKGAWESFSEVPVIKQGLELLGKGIQTIPKIVPAVQKTGEAVSPVTEKILNWYDNLSPEEKRNIDATMQYLSVIPAGKAGGVATEAATKATQATIKGASTLAAPVVKGASEVLSATGRSTKALGKTIFEGAITPTVQEAERLLTYKAKSPFLTRVSETVKGTEPAVSAPQTRATTALEHGIGGSQTMIGIQGKRASDKIWKESIAPAVKESKAIVTKDELFAPIEERIASTIEPSKRKAYEDAFEALKEDYMNVEKFTLEEAQAVKRTLDEFTPVKQFKGKDVANEFSVLKNDVANAIREKTYSALEDVNIKKSYLDWANLHELEKIGVKALTSEGRLGGSGKLVTMLWDMATVPIRTIGGQVLYRVGNYLEFLGNKGIKKFGDFLKQKGYQLPEGEVSWRSQKGSITTPSFKSGEIPEQGQKVLQEKVSFPNSTIKGEKKIGQLYESDYNLLNKYVDAVRLKGKPEAPIMSEKEWLRTEDIMQRMDFDLEKSMSKLANDAEQVMVGRRGIGNLYKNEGLEVKKTHSKDVISQADSSLIQEAKKYKTAEEFVKAQGEPLYHGTTARGREGISKEGFKLQNSRDSFNQGTGISITTDTKIASKFTGKDGEVLDVVLDPKAKLFDGDEFKSLVRKEYNGNQLRGEILAEDKVVKKLKSEGYDGIDYRGRKASESYESEIRIWNTEKLKTKSQLTDIWNKANKK